MFTCGAERGFSGSALQKGARLLGKCRLAVPKDFAENALEPDDGDDADHAADRRHCVEEAADDTVAIPAPEIDRE